MKSIEIVRKLASLSPRQFAGEKLAKNYIIKMLKGNSVDYSLQNFEVAVPSYAKYHLKADGKSIKCIPTSLVGGTVGEGCDIISSLDASYEGGTCGNINYNPHSDGISLANFYDSPSFAVSRRDVKFIKNAAKIEGLIKIKKRKYTSCNILAGNRIDSKNIFFAHYDCFFEGAVDNASGVAVCMSLVKNNKNILKDNLIVFCGAEELSYDRPFYWGKCFRAFESRNRRIMKNAKKVIIVDCVGTDNAEVRNDEEAVSLYFAKKNNDKKKVLVVTSVERRPEKFMSVYHSKADRASCVREKYLQNAFEKCLSIIE
ncbi:MAG: M28 family peptidase [Candidatus Paceibacterota bacterium]|jgi:Iap family predicted aminopeptidase